MANLTIAEGQAIAVTTNPGASTVSVGAKNASEIAVGVAQAATLSELLHGTVSNKYAQAQHIQTLLHSLGIVEDPGIGIVDPEGPGGDEMIVGELYYLYIVRPDFRLANGQVVPFSEIPELVSWLHDETQFGGAQLCVPEEQWIDEWNDPKWVEFEPPIIGACEKYVVDDEEETVRLPDIRGIHCSLDLNLCIYVGGN